MPVMTVDQSVATIRVPFFRAVDRYYVSVIVLAAALTPIYAMATGWLGYRVLVLLVLSCLVGSIVEVLSAKVTKRSLTYLGIAAWLVYPMLVPPGLPLWMALAGLVLSLVTAQTLFGGFGKHMVHPAVFAQLVILLSFPLQFNSSFLGTFRNPFTGFAVFTSTSLTNMTDFDLFSIGRQLPLLRMLVGPQVGLIGEMFPVFVGIAGVAYLILADTNVRTPVSFLVSMVVLSLVGNALFPDRILAAIPGVLGGSTLFYGLFIFSDTWTSTRTRGGRIVAGIVAAFITVVVRSFSSNREGIMFAAIFNYTFGVLYDEIARQLSRRLKRRPV